MFEKIFGSTSSTPAEEATKSSSSSPSNEKTTTADTKKEETSVKSLGEKLAENAFLDLCFVMDSTGSMGSYIASAQESCRSIIEQIVSAEKADVRFALVSYRDHPPQDSSYVTKVYPFTTSISAMKTNLSQLSASGGGDCPEAVADGLHDALKLDWRPQATKITVLISDAPPHGLGTSGDGFPNGCPLGHDPVKITRSMAEEGIVLYVIGCEPAINPYKTFFEGLAYITGGQYAPLSSASSLSQVIVGGAREEMHLEKLMRDVTKEVEELGDMDEVAQTRAIHSKFAEKKTKVAKLKRGDAELAPCSAEGQKYKGFTSMKEAKDSFTPAPSSSSHFLTDDMSTECMTASRSKKASGGFLSSISRSFRSAPSPSAPHMMAAPTMCAYDCDAAPSSSMKESYSVAEEDISVAQVERMIHKSKARMTKS